MSEKIDNTFNEGFNMDASDFVLPKTQLRYGQNVRLFNLQGSNYVLTNLSGTETSFTLTTGFKPIATQEFNEILYIVSYNDDPASIHYRKLEVGSYPSPAYSGGSIWAYRPFNNYNGGSFRTEKYELTSKPVIQKLEIQPDYDRSVNLCFTVSGKKPKIINSKFKSIIINNALEVVDARVGLATSNEYTTGSVLDETTLIVSTDKILKIGFGGLSSGGKLKPGNYTYAFKYMSEDLNKTNIVGQSSICQVAFGSFENARRGGNETQETNYRVALNLTNVDTNFRYLKIYVLYSAGQDALYQQYLEFVNPIEITGENIIFIHDGYEDLDEVTSTEVNLDYAAIDSAGCSTQVGGYYFLADITQNQVAYEPFKNAAFLLTPLLASKQISIISTLPGYSSPVNVYESLGGIGGESYPYGIVFIMPGNVLSPVFPIKGQNFINKTTVGGAAVDHVSDGNGEPAYANDNGVVTYPNADKFPFISGTNLNTRHIKVSMSSITSDIKLKSTGFFFVRGERKTDFLGQGVIIPTMKAPTLDYRETAQDDVSSYYSVYKPQGDSTSFFKFVPCLDSIQEAYMINRREGTDTHVIDGLNKIKDGYMPIYINDMINVNAAYPEVWYAKTGDTFARHWAFLCGDAMVAEPYAITKLNGKKNTSIRQIALLNSQVKGPITPVYNSRQVGMHYDFSSYTYILDVVKTARNISFVPGSTFESGSDFISKLSCTFYYAPISSDYQYFMVMQDFNPFFGIEMEEGVTGQLNQSSKNKLNPIGSNGTGVNSRIGANGNVKETSGVWYDNLNDIIPSGFLINVYENTTRATPNQLYKSIENISYKQITPRYAWSENVAEVELFGGDCYISHMHRKLNQSPYDNPSELAGDSFDLRANINAGMMISWWQESENNLHLRQPKIVDLNEPGERSFFPYQSNGDFTKYREYRLPETTAYSLGYSEVLTSKDHFKISALTPYVENNFFVRVMHSSRHSPNAFKNGYRSFLPSASRDYDSSMGKIVGMFNQRGSLLVVFEHGIGITTIEQRVETASDIAGAVYIQPSEVLPPQLQYASREIGCQHSLSMVQTPSAVYGMDVSKNVIWQFREGVVGISDAGFASFVKNNPPSNPRSGFDFEFKEVLFTTDNWTLCFKEGLEKFTSFYSFRPDLYARRGNSLYSFLSEQSHIHNQPAYTIYGEQKNAIIEFVINQNLDVAKVLDYINVISNEVRPVKAEFFTYDDENPKGVTVTPANCHQYTSVTSGVDIIMEEEAIEYRDKKFIIQVPEVVNYNASLPDDWGIDSKLRNKYFIIRLTYTTIKPLQLASIVSTFRYSTS